MLNATRNAFVAILVAVLSSACTHVGIDESCPVGYTKACTSHLLYVCDDPKNPPAVIITPGRPCGHILTCHCNKENP